MEKKKVKKPITKYNYLSLRGGASRGNVYIKFIKEVFQKNLVFPFMSGASSGGIYAACLACIRNPKRIYELMISLRGDKIMRWACEAEKGEDHNGKKIKTIRRVTKGIGMFLFRKIPYISIKAKFKKVFKWKRLESNGVKELFITVIKQKDVIKVLGKEFFGELKRDGFKDLLDGDGLDDVKLPSKELIKLIPVYYFSNKGIYKKEYGKRTIKISEKVQPLWKVVLATFSNPILPPIRLKFDRKIKEKCFDGGMANNYANCIWDHNNFHQVSCDIIPGEITGSEMGIFGVDTLYYNENRSRSEMRIKTDVEYKGFFGFYDANIEDYYEEEPTKFFG